MPTATMHPKMGGRRRYKKNINKIQQIIGTIGSLLLLAYPLQKFLVRPLQTDAFLYRLPQQRQRVPCRFAKFEK